MRIGEEQRRMLLLEGKLDLDRIQARKCDDVDDDEDDVDCLGDLETRKMEN